MNHFQFVTSVFLLVISSFASAAEPEIIKLSPDTYMISKEDHGGIFGNAQKMKAKIIKQANAFAESQGKVAVPISAKEKPMGVLGQWAAFEYQFRVVSKDDPEAHRTQMAHNPNIVIQKADPDAALVSANKPQEKDIYNELIKLDDLHKRGILTDAEFQTQKRKLLNEN